MESLVGVGSSSCLWVVSMKHGEPKGCKGNSLVRKRVHFMKVMKMYMEESV